MAGRIFMYPMIFLKEDYLYINNKNGTFKESLENQMISISNASMGADMADINNDGYPDIFVTEMFPKRNRSIKTKTTFENWDKYQLEFEVWLLSPVYPQHACS